MCGIFRMGHTQASETTERSNSCPSRAIHSPAGGIVDVPYALSRYQSYLVCLPYLCAQISYSCIPPSLTIVSPGAVRRPVCRLGVSPSTVVECAPARGGDRRQRRQVDQHWLNLPPAQDAATRHRLTKVPALMRVIGLCLPRAAHVCIHTSGQRRRIN